jgi:hypothetical protein
MRERYDDDMGDIDTPAFDDCGGELVHKVDSLVGNHSSAAWPEFGQSAHALLMRRRRSWGRLSGLAIKW